jgi:hypothetical protein
MLAGWCQLVFQQSGGICDPILSDFEIYEEKALKNFFHLLKHEGV